MCPRPGTILNITATMSLALPSAVCVAPRTQSQRSQRSASFGRRCPQYGHGILSPVVGSGWAAGASVYSTSIFIESHKPHRIRQAKRDCAEEDHELRMRATLRNGMIFLRTASGVRRCCAVFHGAATQQTPGDDYVARARCYLFTTLRAGFRKSNCALTFSICTAWSFTVAARRATMLSNSAILFCCFWNSL